MKGSRMIRWGILSLLLVIGFQGAVIAEDVEKKWRLGVALGGMNGRDSIESQAGNVLVLRDPTNPTLPPVVFVEPRNDSGVFGELDIQSGPVGTVSLQYAISKIFVTELNVGYQRTDVGDVEVQAEFAGTVVDQELFEFGFAPFRVEAGELERVPVSLNFLARFRPRANFNPYVGAGLGYSFVGFEPSDEFNELSRNLDRSLGAQMLLSTSSGQIAQVTPIEDPRDLGAAEVDARDTFEMNVFFGAELSFKKKWVAFLDIRHSFSSRQLGISFDGRSELGRTVPQLTDFPDSATATAVYGPVLISEGGLIDGGSIQPSAGSPIDTDCTLTPGLCEFEVGAFDGELDPGRYYIQGGQIEYDALSITAGLRYTF